MRVVLSLYVCMLVCTHWQRTLAEYTYGHENVAENLLGDSNWDLEEDPVGEDWKVVGAVVERTSDAYTGSWGALSYNRTALWSGLKRRVSGLQSDTNYYFSCFVKFLSTPTDGTSFSPNLRHLTSLTDGTSSGDNFGSATVMPPMINTWIHFAGIFKTPPTGLDYIDILISGVPPEIPYVLDTLALLRIDPDPDWKQQASDRIESLRKNTVTFSGWVPSMFRPKDIRIVVNQTRHEFGFGAAVKADLFSSDAEYRDFFFSNFETAGFINALKWKQTERQKDVFDFVNVDASLEYLQQAQIPVHGHALFWNRKQNNPAWVQDLTGAALTDALSHRINSIVPRYKGVIAHWDVCNEDLPENYFEENTGNYDILADLFRNVSLLDPDVGLFLNEYAVIADPGRHLAALGSHVRYLASKGVTVDGLGLQNHHQAMPDPEVMKFRVDFAAQSGVPLWVSELTLNVEDDSERADYLEDMLYMFYSHPGVHGVLIWGILPTTNNPNSSLADTPGVTINAAGQRWQDLVKGRWLTSHVFTPAKRRLNISFPAYHGEYEVEVWNKDMILSWDKFSLPSGADKTVRII